MQAGWEETHDVKKKHKGFKPVDKKEKKEMKKKAKGHDNLTVAYTHRTRPKKPLG